MMRTSERSLVHQPYLFHLARYRVNLGCFQSFSQGHGRQNTGKSFGQHGFSCAGWPNENYIVTPGGRNLHTTLNTFLTLHIAEVELWKIKALVEFGSGVENSGFEGTTSFKEVDHFLKFLHSVNLQIAH